MLISAKARFIADRLLFNNYGANAHMRDFKILQIQSDRPSTSKYDRQVKEGAGVCATFVCQNNGFEYKVYLLKK